MTRLLTKRGMVIRMFIVFLLLKSTQQALEQVFWQTSIIFLGQNLWMKNVISSTHIEGSSKIILLSIIIWEDQRKAHHIQVQKLNMLSCVKIIPIPKKVWTPPTTPYHWQHTKSFHNILFNNEIFHLRKKLTNLEKKLANMMEKIESLELLWAIRCNMVEINFHRYSNNIVAWTKLGADVIWTRWCPKFTRS